jgi:hypothetical protein
MLMFVSAFREWPSQIRRHRPRVSRRRRRPLPPNRRPSAPAPTSGGGNALGNAVNQTLVGLGQSVGQVTDGLLGPQSLVGGTLGALGGALAGASAGG